jgi:hypothetical protein
VKLAKKMLMGSMLLVPTLAMGIAQQDPAAPQQPAAGQQQLQQDQATHPGAAHEMTGVIVEVREDSFSLRSADHTMWFTITPENKSAWSAELVTGNRVTVMGSPGDSPDRMVATSIRRAEGTDTAAGQMPAQNRTADSDVDIDADIDVDDDSVTAELDADREFEDSDTEIAQNELRTDDDAFDTDDDRDELPRTASSLPAIGSLGLLALLGAAAVAFARRF